VGRYTYSIQAGSGVRTLYIVGRIGVARDSRVALEYTDRNFLLHVCCLISYDIAKNVKMFECGQCYYYYYYYYHHDCLTTDQLEVSIY